MTRTITYTVTDAAWTAVTTATNPRSVFIREDPSVANWPTSAYIVAAPNTTNDSAYQSIGQSFSFPANGIYLGLGQIVGYIKLASGGGSTTFQQVEQ